MCTLAAGYCNVFTNTWNKAKHATDLPLARASWHQTYIRCFIVCWLLCKRSNCTHTFTLTKVQLNYLSKKTDITFTFKTQNMHTGSYQGPANTQDSLEYGVTTAKC